MERSSVMSRNEKNAEIFKALGHPVRLQIVENLMKEGKCNVGTIEKMLHLTQSNASRQLSTLKHAGIVKGTRDANEIFYEVSDEKVKDVVRILAS